MLSNQEWHKNWKIPGASKEVLHQYSIHWSNITYSKLYKISRGHVNQEKKASGIWDCGGNNESSAEFENKLSPK